MHRCYWASSLFSAPAVHAQARAAAAEVVLPYPAAPFTGTIGRTYADSKPAAPQPCPPAGAPNVLLVMTDDVGFAACPRSAVRSRPRTSIDLPRTA